MELWRIHKMSVEKRRDMNSRDDLDLNLTVPLVVHCERLVTAAELYVFNSGDFCGSKSAVVP